MPQRIRHHATQQDRLLRRREDLVHVAERVFVPHPTETSRQEIVVPLLARTQLLTPPGRLDAIDQTNHRVSSTELSQEPYRGGIGALRARQHRIDEVEGLPLDVVRLQVREQGRSYAVVEVVEVRDQLLRCLRTSGVEQRAHEVTPLPRTSLRHALRQPVLDDRIVNLPDLVQRLADLAHLRVLVAIRGLLVLPLLLLILANRRLQAYARRSQQLLAHQLGALVIGEPLLKVVPGFTRFVETTEISKHPPLQVSRLREDLRVGKGNHDRLQLRDRRLEITQSIEAVSSIVQRRRAVLTSIARDVLVEAALRHSIESLRRLRPRTPEERLVPGFEIAEVLDEPVKRVLALLDPFETRRLPLGRTLVEIDRLLEKRLGLFRAGRLLVGSDPLLFRRESRGASPRRLGPAQGKTRTEEQYHQQRTPTQRRAGFVGSGHERGSFRPRSARVEEVSSVYPQRRIGSPLYAPKAPTERSHQRPPLTPAPNLSPLDLLQSRTYRSPSQVSQVGPRLRDRR